jgi:hypothetical protein
MTLDFVKREELDAILALIEFHEDWSLVEEQLNIDVSALYDKLDRNA